MIRIILLFAALIMPAVSFAEYQLSGLTDSNKRSVTDITTADTTNNDNLAILESAITRPPSVGNWGSCSSGCGTGKQYRTVSCPSGYICDTTGIATQRNCNTHPCRVSVTGWYCPSGYSLSGSRCIRSQNNCTYTENSTYSQCRISEITGDSAGPGRCGGRKGDISSYAYVNGSGGYISNNTSILTGSFTVPETSTRATCGSHIKSRNTHMGYGDHGTCRTRTDYYEICITTTTTINASGHCPAGYRYDSNQRNCYM